MGKNQTQSRFKDLLEEDSEAESRPDPNHILTFTKTNHQLHASSVTMHVINDMHIKWNEADFFSSPKNKTRLLKEKDNEKSPAQQGSTLKRNFKNHFNSIQGTGFFFFKKGNKL